MDDFLNWTWTEIYLSDTCTAVIIPLVQKFCDEIPKQSSDSLLTVARLFGKLSYGLSGKENLCSIVRYFETKFYVIALFIKHDVCSIQQLLQSMFVTAIDDIYSNS